MTEKLKILFAPVFGVGHYNACIGLAEPLRDRGHFVTFAITEDFKGKLTKLNIAEEVLPFDVADKDERFAATLSSYPKSPEQQVKEILAPAVSVLVEFIQKTEPFFKDILLKTKPDVIVIDNLLCYPSVLTSGIPWIMSLSTAPLSAMPSSEDVPPAISGLPTNGDLAEWKRFEKIYTESLIESFKKHNDFMIQNGAGPLQHFPETRSVSPYANIYMTPKELDYTNIRQCPSNWYQFDNFMRITEEPFEIPETLMKLQGRLVYFSLGSIGSADVGLMKRLIGFLGKSPNRFIISKGMFGDELELPANMWGLNTVPQTSVIPLVDLVITHGGNNTVTESFYFGKPCIVLPLFLDQHENAQRIQELGFGLRFHPYKVTETELLGGIEDLLGNEKLALRMKKISKRIQAASSQSRAADLIEQIARKNMPPRK